MKQEEAAKAKGQTKQQSTLDDVVVKQHSEKAANFSRDRILHEVAKFVACDDQVSTSLLNLCRLTHYRVARHWQLQTRSRFEIAL
jgi:hypothetical protein